MGIHGFLLILVIFSQSYVFKVIPLFIKCFDITVSLIIMTLSFDQMKYFKRFIDNFRIFRDLKIFRKRVNCKSLGIYLFFLVYRISSEINGPPDSTITVIEKKRFQIMISPVSQNHILSLTGKPESSGKCPQYPCIENDSFISVWIRGIINIYQTVKSSVIMINRIFFPIAQNVIQTSSDF